MSMQMSWLARVSVCVAVALSPMLASPALANGTAKNTHKTTAQKPAAVEQISQADLQCLSEALYFEARGEGAQGQRAVAEVILNRVDHPRFPKTVCGVVNQRGQFTYNKGRRMSNAAAAARSRQIAADALAGAPRELTSGATYFHTTNVRPGWSKRFTRTTKIGSHVFYRQGRRVATN